MPQVADPRQTVFAAAGAWAQARGIPSITRIPPEQAAAVVADVAQQTGLPPVVVREHLVKHWSAQNDKAARALQGLGAAATYQGAAGHRPLTSPAHAASGAPATMRPIAALLANKAKAQTAQGFVAAPKDAFAAADRLLSQRLQRELRAAFGEDGARFFQWPTLLAKVAAGAPVEPGLVARFERDLAAAATTDGLSPAVKNRLFAAKAELAGLIDDVARRPSPQAFGVLFDALTPLIEAAAQDRGVFVKGVATGALGETTFRAMRPAERDLERLKRDDPEAYAVVMKRRATLQEWEQGVLAACAAEGLQPVKARILGALVTVGHDEATGEKTVYSPHHGALPMEAFIEERKRFLAEKQALAQEPPALAGKLDDLPKVDLARAQQDGALAGPVRYASLTDDLAKDDPLTRIYAVRAHVVADGPLAGQSRDVVVEGKFAGHYLDTLVDQTGRLVEGRTFRYDEALGRAREAPLRSDSVDREPYVTTTVVKERGREKRKLQLSLPNAQGSWTEVRQAVRALSKRIPSVKYEEGSKNTRFTFEPKDFAVVRDALGGMALSQGALDSVRGFFQELAEADRAIAHENLGAYTTQAIGGFKAAIVAPGGARQDVQLTPKQAQALAWLEANGGKGVVALDTGMGKTMVAIAAMQQALRDAGPGQGEQAGDQRFLFVCPPALRGNLAKEIHRWLEPEAAAKLLDRVDVMSYGAFRAAKRLDPAQYHSVFFDEAQALKNAGNEGAKAALRFNHPRKVCLTASPMEKSPMEAYVLAAVANNVDLAHKTDGKELRREMRKFRERFVETVGGRVVGVVKDDLTKADLHVWMKRNVFFADKEDPSVAKLPELQRRTEAVPMDGPVEQRYRQAVGKLERALQGMVSLFRDQGLIDDSGAIDPRAKDKAIARVMGPGFGKVPGVKDLRVALKELNTLANMPELLVPGAGHPKIERAGDVVAERLRASDESRAVLFSDDRAMVQTAALLLSKQPRFAGKVHAACLSDEIRLYKNGVELTEYAGHKLPFKAKPYRRDLAARPNATDNRHYQKAQWQQFVLGELLSKDRDVLTCTLQGQTYQTGQNLQAFDTCVHLDRDTWCSEDMKQRTARVWRQGQDNAVLEVTIDAVYDAPRSGLDATLDVVRAHHQRLESELFDAIVKQSQTTELGAAWYEMDAAKASFVQLDRATLELMTSPYVERARPPGERDVDG